MTQTASYPVDATNRVKRAHERGAYDHETVHLLLDSAMLAHVAYVIDGQPFCTPTLFWREGTRLYWHGSSASRMLRNLSKGEPACLTVTHFDSVVLGRSAMHHSADYRAVMAFGQARLVSDPQEKAQALTMMVDRFFPERTALLRPMTVQESKATSVVVMEIEKASAKIRDKGIADDEEDYALPIHAERIPLHTVIGTPEPCVRMPAGVARPDTLAEWADGRLLEKTLRRAYASAYAVPA
ncbi:pyridoxamine 5'-phosphate oxidase family protein [Pseudooceanicola sp. CBS1P-1]|uniref:Pyridoxamine 5'-phosphate oxidase family protein n=2 Tax=Paracoccaceae TaxID=31989 RepID=A0A6L7FYC5_9RHOB|nr:pyridoxamine 5'-phosphate oxidase family protein [Pseudooceanicola endophyticus]MXN16248.1 pyridoxamine 5'-phosphate oxidase family protein [Pseudooceanicola albus]